MSKFQAREFICNKNKIELYLLIDGDSIQLVNADFSDDGCLSDDDFLTMSVLSKNIKTKQHFDLCKQDFDKTDCPYLGGTGFLINGKRYYLDLETECMYTIHADKPGTFTGMDSANAFPNGFSQTDINNIINGLNAVYNNFIIVTKGTRTGRACGQSDEDYCNTPQWFKDEIGWED